MQGYSRSQPLVLLWLGRRVVRVMRNGCGCSGGGSSAKACAWDEYINSGLCTASLSAWVGGGRPRRTLWVVRWVVGGVVRTLQAICRVRRGRISQGWVGAATFAGLRADGGWCGRDSTGGRSVCGVDVGGIGWWMLLVERKKNLRGGQAGLRSGSECRLRIIEFFVSEVLQPAVASSKPSTSTSTTPCYLLSCLAAAYPACAYDYD